MSFFQPIENPHGVTVYGSHVLRVTPDLAEIALAINRTAAKPKEAFTAAREATQAVRSALRELGVPDSEVRASRVSLETKYRKSDLIGHRATVEISIALSDLSSLESVLVAAVDAGADQVKRVQFKAMKLRELRRRARREAVADARDKAQLYAEAAGISLGQVTHIEDLPTNRNRRYAHVVDDVIAGAESEGGAYDPGMISVAGAVSVSYAILD